MKKENFKEIINRIVYFRKLKGYSARTLSLMIDKHDTYIGKLEAQQFNMSMDTFLDIIDALDVTLDEFFATDLQNKIITKK